MKVHLVGGPIIVPACAYVTVVVVVGVGRCDGPVRNGMDVGCCLWEWRLLVDALVQEEDALLQAAASSATSAIEGAVAGRPLNGIISRCGGLGRSPGQGREPHLPGAAAWPEALLSTASGPQGVHLHLTGDACRKQRGITPMPAVAKPGTGAPRWALSLSCLALPPWSTRARPLHVTLSVCAVTLRDLDTRAATSESKRDWISFTGT